MALFDARSAVERGQHGEPRPIQHEVLTRAEDQVARVAVLGDPDVALQNYDAAALGVRQAQRLAGLQVDAGNEVAEVHGDSLTHVLRASTLSASAQRDKRSFRIPWMLRRNA